MCKHPWQEHPRRRDAGRFPVGARARPDPPKEPRGQTAAKKDFVDGAINRPSRLSHKAAPRNGDENGQRIAKVMARAGLCSRREAEAWIGEGRVALNGVPLTNPAINVRRNDKITVDGEPLAYRARTRLFLFHKPRGLVTTARDPRGRPTIFDYLREHWPAGPRVVSIGRLDINSEGLLLLTNDGGLARVLELPATGWVRRYRVRAKGETDQSILDRLREELTLDGVRYAGIEATLDRAQGANSWLTMALREGKNREIKRVLEHIGLQVNRLIRLSFGPFQLGELAEGAVKEVRTRVLRDQLGPALAKAAGTDFSSPLDAENEAADVVNFSNARQQKSNAGPGRDYGDPPGRRQSREPARQRGGGRQPEPRVRLKVKPAPPTRKHVSALRAEYDELPKERKRIERRETADRGGRTVYVERLVSVKREDKRKPTDTGDGRGSAAGSRDRDDASERSARHGGGPAASSKFEQEGGRRAAGSPVSRARRGRDQAQKRSNGPRSPRPVEKRGGGRPVGDVKPTSGGGPRGRGGTPKERPRGKS
jgi:23S rRNA pseudouridine2605 synthase